MTYYDDHDILIRNLEPGDVEEIVREEQVRGLRLLYGYGRFRYTSR